MAKLAICLTLTIPIPLHTEQDYTTSPTVRITHAGVWPPPPFPPPSPPPTYYAWPIAPKDGQAWLDRTSRVARGAGRSGTATLDQIRMCESRGNYGSVSGTGKFRGAYQFDQGTWDGAAPEGWAGVPPDEAPPEIQDEAAANLQAARGNQSWPTCGR